VSGSPSQVLPRDGELARLVLQSTGQGIYDVDMEGRCTFANPACLRLLGFDRESDVLGRHMHDLVHHTRPNGDPYPAEQCRIYKAFRAQTGVHVDDEVMFRRDGSSFPAEYWSYPLLHNGELIGCVVAFVDITDRRRLEDALVSADSRLRSALAAVEQQAAELSEVARFPEMNPGPVLRLDLAGCVLMANSAATGLFGQELVGRSWREICSRIDDELWQQILVATQPVNLEARMEQRDWVFAHRRDPEGHLVFVFGADITTQKQTETALRQSEKMATLGTLAAGVAHELNNPAAATRRAAEQLRGSLIRLENAEDALDAAGIAPEARASLRAMEGGTREHAVRPGDLDPMARADREAELEDWLEENGVPDPGRYASDLVAHGMTTGDLDRLARTFEGAGLAAALDWIASAYQVYALLHEIGQGAGRISEIVRALKSYSFLGQAPVQAVDLHEGLDNTLIILRSKLKVGITVEREYCSDLPLVPAWGSELNQVWTNLLDNAADALGGKGRITIRTHAEDGWAVVEIVDDGPGIPEAIQCRIFDPFFTTKAPGQGTGLGLATTYSIVTEKHRGHIGVESRPGETRFTVRLPLDPPPSEGRTPDQGA